MEEYSSLAVAAAAGSRDADAEAAQRGARPRSGEEKETSDDRSMACCDLHPKCN